MNPCRQCGFLGKLLTFAGTVLFTLTLTTFFLHGQEPWWLAGLTTSQANGWRGVSAQDGSLGVYEIEASTNFIAWRPIARLHGGFFTFYDPQSLQAAHRFYRAWKRPLTPEDDWKNQFSFNYDPMTAGGGYELTMGWIKFCIPVSEPFRVYYQDSIKYPLHGDFATVRLPQFVGMSRSAFDAVSLFTNGQQVVLGTVLLPGGTRYSWQQGNFEYGVQFVGQDPYPPEKIRDWFELVQSTIINAAGVKGFYVPTFEQSANAKANAAFFATNGIALESVERWLSGDTVYSPGWAIGRLVYINATNINAAYSDGRLLPSDILLTDAVPAEVPFVAGIVTLAPATPNSHVAILARAYRVPFAYLHELTSRQRAQALTNKEIILSAYANIQLLDVDGTLDSATRAEIVAMKQPEPVHARAKVRYGAYSASAENLVPEDIRYFGGKAANFGLLRRTIPSNSPPAIALSMDLWDDFLDQTLPSGRTLRAEITNRLAGLTYPPQMVSLQSNLATIRSLIRSPASFNAAQRAAILSALQVFPPLKNIRFRSSSNAEDSESFTAAGLLDSYSGCVADDTDSDTSGPSRCDPSESNERGVFRAIQRVYSSFYNDNAFLERLRHGINEDEVGVGVLVHQSFPDDTELANGVATLDICFGSDMCIRMITQPGAASVTNPDSDAQAEDVSLRVSGTIYGPYIAARSSLMPVGQTVLPLEEYVEFAGLFSAVQVGYRDLFPGKTRLTLDLEYKKIVPDWLVIKQVREIPQPPDTNVVPFLINKPLELCAFQGELSNPFVNHAYKCRGTIETRNIRLTETNLSAPFYSRIDIEFVDGTNIWRMNEDSASWTNVQHVVDGETVTDTFPATTNRPAITLVATIRRSVGANESPWLTIESLSLSRDGGPVFIPDVEGNFQSTVVRLLPCLTVTSNSFLQSRRAVIPGAQLRVDPEIVRDVHIQTRFYWPDPATIVRNGNTAPLVQFVDTTITGVTTEPIVLHGYFSQTYWPIHHNYYEYLLFDPWLEPGLSSEQRSELAELGIQWLLFWTNPGSGESFSGILYVMDFSGNFRQASQCGPWGCDEDLSSKLAPYGVSEPVGSH